MATASPTPAGQGSQFTSLGRRTSARQALRRPSSKPQLTRSESNPVPQPAPAVAVVDPISQSQGIPALNDSSDDEMPVPMKLSALTKALLNDDGSVPNGAGPAPPMMTRRRSVLSKSGSSAAADKEGLGQQNVRQTRRHIRAGSAQVSSRETSPVPRKRIVRLSTTPAGGNMQAPIRQSLSASRHGKRPASHEMAEERNQPESSAPESRENVNTPANRVRRVQIAVGSSGSRPRLSSSSIASTRPSAPAQQLSDQEAPEEPGTEGRHQASESRFGTSTRPKEGEGAPQSSMRVKRVGKLPGGFLSGPARRGKRRQSDEEEHSPLDDNADEEHLVSGQESHERGHESAYPAPYIPDFAASGSPVSAKDPARAGFRKQGLKSDIMAASGEADVPQPLGTEAAAAAGPPPLSPLRLPSGRDQENDLHHDFKKPSKIAAAEIYASGPAISSLPPPSVGSPQRRPALSTLSKNTPHRPAPPPPKMTVLETATAPAGAATASQASKKQRVLLKVNGRPYQRVDCIGRGGSAKVYKVTAENGKMFALKRVSIETADENTIKGYLGEIDLLKKLSGVDRVIRLFDYEMNQEKQMLSLLMEMGELDLNSILRVRQNPEGSKLDPVFVCFYWKEMLECLQAVHAHDIVHSDLKPANFVVVKGNLKLIDFGIANAIQTDETVNVHREAQIGTPSYMSPESLMDSQQYAFTAANNGRLNLPPGAKGPKLMKLGKPSDVWSLGCILYQMVYGQTPFGHIQNQMARCHAIINWNHTIDFPERGLGGVAVPPSLLRTMKACLNREQQSRPTCDELLLGANSFLYPQERAPGLENALPVTEELLGRIIQSVVARCRDRMPTDAETLSTWPAAYWASVRRAVGPSKEAKS